MDKLLWEMQNVTLGRGPTARLRDVTLGIRPGVTAILGCSGAGKTSLLNLLVAFERPDAGRIISDLPKGQHALPLYWVPQHGGLWPHLTARQHLEAVATDSTRPEIDALLEAAVLADRARAHPHELSQGEQSRLSLLRAIAADPAAFVMDEPLAGVDPAMSGRIWRWVQQRISASGASLVYTTHLPGMVIGEAGRVICIRDGRVLCEGETEALYLNPPSREAAESLGEINWFSPEESRLWLSRETRAPIAYRPERIVVQTDEGSALRVETSCFKGAVTRLDLRHEKTGDRRAIWHRPAGNGMKAGTRVRLTLLLSLMLLVLAACGKAAPPLVFSETRVLSMPPDGKRIPAPRGITVSPDGDIYVLDTAGRVLVFSRDGKLQRQWSMPDVSVGKPEGIHVFKDGGIVVADTHYHRLVYFDHAGAVKKLAGKEGNGNGDFIYPVAVTADDQENLYVCEYGGNDRVQKFTREGKFLLSFGTFGTAPGQFQRPSGVVWLNGKVYVSDAMNNRIQEFTDDGKFLGVLDDPAGQMQLRYPYGIHLGAANTIYAVEYSGGCVTQFDTAGKLLGRCGKTGSAVGEFATPWGLAVDQRGHVLVADTGNRRIVELIP